jgi:hypothetical protein
MIVFILLVGLTGFALGLRYKVLVLVPMFMLTLLLSAAYGFNHDAGMAATAFHMLLAVIALQLGYLVGAGMNIAAARARLQASRHRLRAEGV